MRLKQRLVCLVATVGMFLPTFAIAAANGFGGEIYFSPQFGGTDFSQTTGPTDHSRSWDFFFNLGLALGLKVAYHGDIVSFGLGTDLGWKEEAIEHRRNNVVSEYDYQMFRAYGGGFFTFGKIVHAYLGYDPLVYAKMTMTDNEHVNPFRKNDVLKGYAYSAGVGVTKDDVLIRILGRTTIYNEVESNGVEAKLPNEEYSKLNTGELVFQLGQRF